MSYGKLILGRLVSLTLFRCHQVYCTVLLHNVTYVTTAVELQLGADHSIVRKKCISTARTQ